MAGLASCREMCPSTRPLVLRIPRPNININYRSKFYVVAAKKKGGKKSAKKQQSSSLQPAATPKPYLSTPVIMQNLLMVESYFRKTGRPLFEEEVEISDVAELLWNAPFAILAHDTSADPEPTFVYGNSVALELFECTWDELIGTPSSKSAAPEKEIQEDRSSLLEAAKKDGFVDDYEGWRRSFTGKAFKISNSTVFNIESPNGDLIGQGAVLRLWEYEDGKTGGPLAEPVSEGQQSFSMNEEQVKEAEERVEKLASHVRLLKEEKGLTNNDQEVKEAVKELLEAKDALASLRGS